MAMWSEILLSETLRAGRQDAEYYQPAFLAVQRRLDGMLANGEADLLGDVATVEYGYMPMQDYVDAAQGEPLLRVTNLKGNLETDDADLVYIPKTVSVSDKKRLKAGDALVVQCGDTTGKVGYAGSEHHGMLFPSFCLRVRTKGNYSPDGLALFMFCNYSA